MSQSPYSKLLNSGVDFVPTIHKDTYPAIDPTQFDLSGKTILVTGASKGIGRASASSYAKAGASNIVIAARSSLDEVETEVLAAAKAAGRTNVPTILKLKLDVSSQASVEAAAAAFRERFSSLDVLVNNAGYLEPWDPVPESDPKNWWTTYEVNVLGTYLMCRSFLPLVLESELKTVLNVVSYGAHAIRPGGSAYQSSKLAVMRFTEFLVAENAEKGLIAFSCHPGSVPTELAKGMPEYMIARLKDTPQLGGDSFVAWTAVRRDWITSRFLSVAWDFTELETKKDEIVKGDLLRVRMAVEGP